MNRKVYLLVCCVLASFAAGMRAQDLPFHRGVNLTNWFQTSGPREIQFSKFTKKDFENIKSLGANVIRLPINLHAMTSGAPTYTLDPLFLYFLDQVVTWAEELQLHLILDNHTFDPAQPTDTTIGDVLVPVWTQMATHYAEKYRNLYYEVLNEPHGITDAKWNEIQQQVITAIRSVDTIHTIIVGASNWNSYNNLANLPDYNDTKLIYTFHFYDPFVFTHQGAGWTDPPMDSLAGVPFPYDAQRMPSCPPSLRGTWVETALQYYHMEGTVAKIKERLNIAIQFRNNRNVPVYCGEFGVLMTNSPEDDRVLWYNEVRQYLEANNIPWTIWDYQGGFGLFEKNSNELFEHDLNVPLLEALGFSVPPQTPYVLQPDSAAIVLYTDYIGEKITNNSYVTGTLDFYNTTTPQSGNYCLYWNGAQQYQSISLDFKPNKDLSYLKENNYGLDLWVRGTGTAMSVDVRFVDSKISNEDHPWRMRFVLTPEMVAFNAGWQHIHIPLTSFVEHGAWDNNTWYTPQGLFDWSDVDKFEIVAEYGNLPQTHLWFDDIGIVVPSANSIPEHQQPQMYAFLPAYPNPFNPTTTLEFSLSGTSSVTLSVFDALGRSVATLVDGTLNEGTHKVCFDGEAYASGIYYARLRAISLRTGQSFVRMQKLVLLK